MAGAAKNSYQLNEYDRAVNPYKALARDYNKAWKEGRWADVKQLKADNPVLSQFGHIDNLLKTVNFTRKWIEDLEKAGKKPSDDVLAKYRLQQQAVIDAIRAAERPVDNRR